MDRKVIKDFLDDPQNVLQEVLSLYPTNYDEYHNPFERKWTLRKSDKIIRGLIDCTFLSLTNPNMCWWVSRLLNVPIEYGDFRHYGGVFVYPPGSYLKPHVDAGRHPQNHQIKIATAVLYLTPAQLVFWKGDVAWFDSPTINQIDEVINIAANSCILFTNHDTAYHEVPRVTALTPRVCVTVSYIAPPDFKSSRFMNDRTRAYFARHMSHTDSPELARLREARASEEHHEEVYRV